VRQKLPQILLVKLLWKAYKVLDSVAYVRFASVYKNFREAKDFEEFVGVISDKKE
jgi:transcriptional repressor NrdR